MFKILFCSFGCLFVLVLSADSAKSEIVLFDDENHLFVLQEVEPRGDSVVFRIECKKKRDTEYAIFVCNGSNWLTDQVGALFYYNLGLQEVSVPANKKDWYFVFFLWQSVSYKSPSGLTVDAMVVNRKLEVVNIVSQPAAGGDAAR